GAVLYEMLTARQAFGRGGLTETVAAVIRGEPGWTAMPRALPDAIGRLVRRCLIKDQTRRLQAMGEARIVTEEWLANPKESVTVSPRGIPLFGLGCRGSPVARSGGNRVMGAHETGHRGAGASIPTQTRAG